MIQNKQSLRSSLDKAALVLARETSRHPGSVNRELNGLMGVDRRADASTDQLREALKYAGDRLRALARRPGDPRLELAGLEEADFAAGDDPPF